MNRVPAIVCDLDGTLAIKSDRSFNEYDRVGEDLICNSVKEVLVKFSPSYSVILVSGRENIGYCRFITEFWLKMYEVPYNELFMRNTKDFRSDDIVKREIYESYIKPFYNVLFVIGDRNKVVKMWREAGLTCFQCSEGNF